MAFYAELRRRNWYCICGVNQIRQYRKHLYDTWWNSLTEEEQEKVKQIRRKKEEADRKEAREAIGRLLVATGIVTGLTDRYR